jgi:UDP-N-acetylmuramoyl-L-alanyl-D-glutamate--2,6-diaminopimelate ligase
VAVVASKAVDVKVPVIRVKDTNMAMSLALSKFYDEADKKMKLIGVTGTNGKTTTATIVYQLINSIDKCGYIGTNGIECDDFKEKTTYTTPLPKELYCYLNKFYQSGCHYVSMETSSERLLTKRLEALSFEVAIFTNIGVDHLDKHKTMDNYIESKGRLFKLVKNQGYCIINNDDKYAKVMQKASNGRVITYGINNQADVMAKDIVVKKNKLTFTLQYFGKEYQVKSPLSGMFNTYNLMAVIATCVSLGFNIEKVIDAIKHLRPIESRLEFLDYGQPYEIVLDYAHTAGSLQGLLEYINIFAKGKIITVTGAAGGRDSSKRADMGEVVTRLSDHVIFTTDDPRFEDPHKIIDDLMATIKSRSNYERETNRALAIHKALSMAEKGDVVVIAGKGRDNYMAVEDKYIPYCDVDSIEQFFEKKKEDF